MSSDRRLNIVVIGGGAAGFFGAIACAEAHPHAQIILLETARDPLAKVRISGGGRCNVTHACFDPALLVQHYPRGGKPLRGAFSRFQAKDTIAWFEAHGVRLKTEADGRMFPITDDSATIVKCLMDAATRAGVKIRAGVSVKSVAQREEGFHLVLKGGEELQAEQVLLATGSSPQGYAIARSLGHTIEPPVPSLFTFTVPDPRLQNLAGVSIQTAHLRLQAGSHKPLEQTGAVLITHWGMSGPAVLKLSAWGARVLSEQQYRATLTVNWLPQYNPETLRQDLLKVKSQLPRRSLSGSCPVPIPRRLWEQLVSHVGIGAEVRWAEVSNKHLNSLIQELTRGEFKIAGKGAFKDEFVTCGGVNLKEVDFKTMESRCCPGLFLAGEVLDIDGVTGGFNFQSAWTTGWLAGQAMADL